MTPAAGISFGLTYNCKPHPICYILRKASARVLLCIAINPKQGTSSRSSTIKSCFARYVFTRIRLVARDFQKVFLLASCHTDFWELEDLL